MTEFDFTKAVTARDKGMDLVAENNKTFADQFGKYLNNLPHGWIGTCEDIRKVWLGVQPSHPNAWGSCWGAAKRRGILVELPQQVNMTAIKSHARKTHLHRRV